MRATPTHILIPVHTPGQALLVAAAQAGAGGGDANLKALVPDRLRRVSGGGGVFHVLLPLETLRAQGLAAEPQALLQLVPGWCKELHGSTVELLLQLFP